MKKQFVTFIFITILLNGLILFFLSSIGEYGAKMHYAFSKQSQQNEIQFQFSSAELKSHRHDKNELLVDNQLYDIVAVQNVNGLFNVTCVQDKHETFFVNLLRSHTNSIDFQKSQKNLVQLLQYLSLISISEQESFQICLCLQEQHLNEHQIFHIEYLHELDTPPPQA